MENKILHLEPHDTNIIFIYIYILLFDKCKFMYHSDNLILLSIQLFQNHREYNKITISGVFQFCIQSKHIGWLAGEGW